MLLSETKCPICILEFLLVFRSSWRGSFSRSDCLLQLLKRSLGIDDEVVVSKA